MFADTLGIVGHLELWEHQRTIARLREGQVRFGKAPIPRSGAAPKREGYAATIGKWATTQGWHQTAS